MAAWIREKDLHHWTIKDTRMTRWPGEAGGNYSVGLDYARGELKDSATEIEVSSIWGDGRMS